MHNFAKARGGAGGYRRRHAKERLKAADVPPTPEGIPEEVVVDGRNIYVSYPKGQGRSALDARYWRQYPKGTVVTARNWRTVLALVDL